MFQRRYILSQYYNYFQPNLQVTISLIGILCAYIMHVAMGVWDNPINRQKFSWDVTNSLFWWSDKNRQENGGAGSLRFPDPDLDYPKKYSGYTPVLHHCPWARAHDKPTRKGNNFLASFQRWVICNLFVRWSPQWTPSTQGPGVGGIEKAKRLGVENELVPTLKQVIYPCFLPGVVLDGKLSKFCEIPWWIRPDGPASEKLVSQALLKIILSQINSPPHIPSQWYCRLW